MNGGPVRFLAMAPALVVIPSAMLPADWVLVILTTIAVVVLGATIRIVPVTGRGFRGTKVLS